MLEVKVIEANGFNQKQLKKVFNSAEIIKSVLNSSDFKNKILNFTQPNGVKNFHFRRGLFGKIIDMPYTNSEVFEMLAMAKEHVGDINSNQIDLYLNLLDENNKDVVGYGNPEEKEIYTYKNWFNDLLDEKEYAAHIIHEWTHKLGFDHAFSKYARKREYSVPYAVGDIFKIVADKMPI